MVTGLRSERRGRERASRLAYLIESLGKCEAASSLGRWPPLVCLASTLEGIKGFNLATRLVPFLSSLVPFLNISAVINTCPARSTAPLATGVGGAYAMCGTTSSAGCPTYARSGAADLVLLSFSSSCLRIPTRFHSLLPPFLPLSLSPADCQPSLVPLSLS